MPVAKSIWYFQTVSFPAYARVNAGHYPVTVLILFYSSSFQVHLLSPITRLCIQENANLNDTFQ